MQTKSIAMVAGAATAGGVLALAGLNLATAATGSQDAIMGERAPMAGPYGRGPGGPGGPHGTPVTGEAAEKVTAAVQAQYPDATVMFVEEQDGGYEAHVRKADGTMVHVTLDADFQITGEHTGPAMGPGGPGRMGPGHHEKALTGIKAKKVKAAAKAELPGATVIRVEKDRTGYEAHMVKTNGTHVVVSVGKGFRVTDVETMPAPGRMGPPPAAPESDPASA